MTKQTNAAVDLFNEFAVDEALSQDGVWVPYTGDVEFLIARAGNKNYRKVAQNLYQKNVRLIESKTEASSAKMDEVVIEAMVKGVLLGWKGNLKFQGEALEYSATNARKLLQMERFREWVDAQSKDEQQFAAVQEAEDGENLPV